MYFSNLITALALGSAAHAHMDLLWPAPFRASYNPYADQNTIDYSMTSPLNSDGSNFPCKGYQTDMGTDAGKSVVTWEAGGDYNFTVQGGATHGGGSCQIALSYDKGTSFTVIHSYIGSCPLSSGEDFQFTMPADAPTGESMFAWVWYNEIGNREIYMNCASVTIGKGSGSAPSTPFDKRPDLFIANLNNGCTTVEGKEVQYPDPGPDVTTKNANGDDSGSFTGTCAAVKGIGGGSGTAPTGGSDPTGTSPATSAAPPATSAPAPEQTTMSTITTSVTSTSTVTLATGSSVAPGVFFTATASGTGPAAPTSTGSAGAQPAGSPCATEGMWNCIDGTSFQQCASGMWSVVQPVAAGTTCTPGESSTFKMAAVAQRDLGKQNVRRALKHFRA